MRTDIVACSGTVEHASVRLAVHADRMPVADLQSPIERIVVFRALVLGDLLCATPALRALRAGFPQAEITLVGLPWAAGWVERVACVDRFIEFPGWPGLPERPCDVRAWPDFLAQVQSQRFDLAVQLHGSGPVVNALVATFGARQHAGFFNDQAWVPEEDASLFTRWPEAGHEIDRLLALTDALGLPRQGRHLDFAVTDDDRAELQALWPGFAANRPYVCVHAGAQLASRRWLPERFAAVADRMAAAGRTVVLTGGASEAALVHAVQSQMNQPAVNLVGQTSLWTLGALIQRAERVVCNDTGVSHVAAAMRTPSVVISSGADVQRWTPLDAERHPVLWQPMPCRPCSHAVCPVELGCAQAIGVEQVMALLDEPPLPSRDAGTRPGIAPTYPISHTEGAHA